jgi:hypothetical protein
MKVVVHACRATARRIYLQSVGAEHNHDDPHHGLVLVVVKCANGPDHWCLSLVFSYRYLGFVAANHSGDAVGGASKPGQDCYGWNLPIAGVAVQMNKL